MKYLNSDQVRRLLSSGRSIEQWLGYQVENDYRIIRWLRIDKERDNTFSTTKFESFDDGNLEMLDIYAFELVDPDCPYGQIDSFETIEAALFHASNMHGAEPDRFVGEGMIQELYREFLEENGVHVVK